jgi:hypothetical protein
MIEQTYEMKSIPRIQKIIAIFWPSFLMAGIATVVFFNVFDPIDLGIAMGIEGIDRLEGYSIGFLLFWLLTSSSSSLTGYFEKPCDEINRKLSK